MFTFDMLSKFFELKLHRIFLGIIRHLLFHGNWSDWLHTSARGPVTCALSLRLIFTRCPNFLPLSRSGNRHCACCTTLKKSRKPPFRFAPGGMY